MLSPAQANPLTRRFQIAIASTGNRAAALLARTWLGLESRDRDDVDRFLTTIRPYVTAAKAAAVELGGGYYSTLLQIAAQPVNPLDIAIADELSDPFIAYWRALKTGRSFEEAIAAGASRAEAVARNVAVSASRRTGDHIIREAGLEVEGWRRQLDGNACEWCRGLTAYTFPTAEAADFGHDRCGCSAVPVLA